MGGVVVARNGSNPMEVINNVKAKIAEMQGGMPEKTLKDGSTSRVTVVPFYDRTRLIKETIGTLESSRNPHLYHCCSYPGAQPARLFRDCNHAAFGGINHVYCHETLRD